MDGKKGSNEKRTSSFDEGSVKNSSSSENEDDTINDDDDDDDDEEEESDDSDDEDTGDSDKQSDDYFKNPEEFDDEDIDLYDNKVDDYKNDYSNNDNEPWWEGKEKIIALTVGCCCCICLILIGVIVGVAMGAIGGDGKDDGNNDFGGNDGSKPTLRPTFAPQPLPPSMLAPQQSSEGDNTDITSQPTETQTPTSFPTDRPTAYPTKSFAPTKSIPETLGIISEADTYVILDGEFQGEKYGDYDTLLVQNGPLAEDTIPDSVGLIAFPLDDVPSIDRLNKNGNTRKNAVLRLTHFVPTEDESDSVGSTTSATYTITRLPETKMQIEYYHGYFFRPPTEEENEKNGVIPFQVKFNVKPDDTEIDIDITSLLFEYSDQQTSMSEEESEEQQSKPQTQLLLMISNEGREQVQGGDRFYTRLTSTPPQLLIDFMGGDAADVNSVLN